MKTTRHPGLAAHPVVAFPLVESARQSLVVLPVATGAQTPVRRSEETTGPILETLVTGVAQHPCRRQHLAHHLQQELADSRTRSTTSVAETPWPRLAVLLLP